MSINLSNINEQVKLPEYYNDYNYYSLLDDLHDNPDEKITKKDLCAVGFSYHGKKACAFTVYPEDDNTSFNNITEYKCIFRSKEPIVKTSYDEDDFGYDDKGKPILSTNSVRRPFIVKTMHILILNKKTNLQHIKIQNITKVVEQKYNLSVEVIY